MTKDEADNAANWRDMDGVCAYLNIERSAANWQEVGAYMDAWMRARINSEREAIIVLCAELDNDENTDDYRKAARWMIDRIRARGTPWFSPRKYRQPRPPKGGFSFGANCECFPYPTRSLLPHRAREEKRPSPRTQAHEDSTLDQRSRASHRPALCHRWPQHHCNEQTAGMEACRPVGVGWRYT